MSLHTIPDATPPSGAMVASISIVAAPVVAPVTVAAPAAPTLAPTFDPSFVPPPPAFVTAAAAGLVIPPPPGFMIAPSAFPTPAAMPLPVVGSASAVATTPSTEPRPFTASISDEGSIRPLALSTGDMDFPHPPSRSMMESFFWDAPEDPILTQKMEPEVAARRARFQRFVKGTVGGCAATCVIALFCTLVGYVSDAHAASVAHESDQARSAAVVHVAKTSVQTLEDVSYGKAKVGVSKTVRARSQARR